MMNISRARSGWIALGLAGFLLACLQVHAAAADDLAQSNQTLLSATSPFEDMVGPALSGDGAGLAKVLSAADAQAAAVRKALPPTAAPQFDELLASIHKSVAARDHYAAAEGAV